MHPRALALVAVTILGASTAVAAPERPRGPVRVPERYRARILEADSLNQSGHPDLALRILSALVGDARARRDSADLLLLLRMTGESGVNSGNSARAEPFLREAVRLAAARRDSSTLCRATRLLASSLAAQGKGAAAEAGFRAALDLARRQGRGDEEGIALTGLGFAALTRGDARGAVANYERAARMLHREGDRRYEMMALTGLGRAYSELLGDFDRARRCFREVAEISRRSGFWWTEGHALNNLGVLEYSFGDPGAATQDFRRARWIFRSRGSPAEAVTPAHNVALAERDLGHYDDAAAILDSSLAECEAGGSVDSRVNLLKELGRVRLKQGRPHEAATVLRRAVALFDSASVVHRIESCVALSDALAMLDSAGAAAAVLEGGAEPLRERAPIPVRLTLDMARSRLWIRAGRYEDALGLLLEVDREAGRAGIGNFRVDALTRAAACERSLGRPDSALAQLWRAARIWEAERRVPLDPEWRAQRGAAAQQLAQDLVALTLDDPAGGPPVERARRAFDLLQRFKARTLTERMRGPGHAEGNPDPGGFLPVTLEKLQREILRRDELLLDTFVGADTTLLFAVTRTECRALRLPGGRVLGPRLSLYRDLLRRAPAGGDEDVAEATMRAGTAFARLLLGACSDLVARSRRILFVPDGPLNLLPLGALFLGAAEGGPDRPLIATHEIMTLPSATLIAAYRADRGGRKADGSDRVLAIAAERGPGGGALPGAVREVRHLGSRYERVDVRVISERDSVPPIEGDLARYDGLHIAAHTLVDDQHPWRSGIQLAPHGDGSRETYLRASRIASLELSARLAVLSGCESAGGQILSGEGVQGLAAAFVAAGVPAVVATLWPVDDRATTGLMDRFYDGLARGHSACAALRAAQVALRGDPRTRAPFYWAAFVLVGDGDARLSLRRRRHPLIWAGPAVVAVIVAGAVMTASGRRRDKAMRVRRGGS